MKAIERVYIYLSTKELSIAKFERASGLSNGYLGGIKSKGSDMGEGAMLKILENFQDINPEWLLTGSGPMLREEASKQTEVHGDVIEQEGIVNMGKGNVIGCDAIRIKMLEEKCAEQAQQIEDLKKDKELLSQLVKGMMTK